jgi:hypothetical protein
MDAPGESRKKSAHRHKKIKHITIDAFIYQLSNELFINTNLFHVREPLKSKEDQMHHINADTL